MDTLIAVQDEYIEAFMSAKRRWSHRKNGGHSGRRIGAARSVAERKMARLGFPANQIPVLIKDARDMAELELACE